ncbi:MAG: hypothetical protein AMXMBFR33_72800 [Candidatus Xenobia bacterium]
MSEPTQKTQAVQRVGPANHSPSPPSVAPSAAANRATGGASSNGNVNHQTASRQDGFSRSDEGQAGGADSLTAGLASWLGGAVESAQESVSQGVDRASELYRQATSRFNLTDDEKKQLKHGLSTLEKLAGDDRRWNSNDLADNMQQLQMRSFLKPVAESQLRKGIEEMTGQPVEKLTPQQREEAARRWQALTPEQRQARSFDRQDLNQFSESMDMVKSKARELGLPEEKFRDGMSVDFLQGIIENQPAIFLRLRR